MCVIQQLPSGLETFGTISDFIIKRITKNDSNKVMFITDQYFETSIKGGERERRASSGQIRIMASRPDQLAPKQFKKCLSIGANRTELLQFLLNDWCHPRHRILIGMKSIYFTLRDEGCEIRVLNNSTQCFRIPQLFSKKEEADTKLFLAAKYACNQGSSSVTIHTVDSDVAILAFYFASKMRSPLYLKIGTGKNERILNVSEAHLEESFSKSLPGLHAFSGCYSTSAFHAVGKIKLLKLVRSNKIYRDAFCLLGESLLIPPIIFEAVEQLVYTAYGFANETSIDEVRYQKCWGKELLEPSKIPPTRDEMMQHIKRANYQTFVWKQSLEIDIDIPDSNGYGWDMIDGHLRIHWMDNKPAPDEILELVVCNCKKSKSLKVCFDECQCVQLGIQCTEICRCQSDCNTKITDV